MTRSGPEIREIAPEDADTVCLFLSRNLNPRVRPAEWMALIRPPWGSVGPNHGYQMVDGEGRVIGVYVAVYSTREAGARMVCNLAAFCVAEEYRAHSLRLLRAILRPEDYLFTDLSPSGNVPALNDRLGFKRLDVATRLVLTTPRRVRRVEVTESAAALEGILGGADAEIYRDHRQAAAARHVLVRSGKDHAYLVYRRDRRKRLPVFASPLYAGGDRELLRVAWPAVSAHLWRRGHLAVLAERRVLGFAPAGPGWEVGSPRPKMYRGELPTGASVDYLYSELTLLRW